MVVTHFCVHENEFEIQVPILIEFCLRLLAGICFHFLFDIIDLAPVHGVDCKINLNFVNDFSAAFDIRVGHKIAK